MHLGLSQTDDEIAATTLAVLWNAGTAGEGVAAGRHFASAPLGALLHDPFTALGSTDPELDSSVRDVVDRHDILGEYGRRPERHRGDQRAKTSRQDCTL